MKKTNDIHFLSLQLFAEGGGEGGNTGVTAEAAAPQKNQGVKDSFGGDAPGQKRAPDAGVRENRVDASDGEFERLIKGRFKEAYERRVSDIVQKRLKGVREAPLQPSQSAAVPEGQEDREISSQATQERRQERLAAAQERIRGGQEVYDQWLRQAEAARMLYPGLDLQVEARDPAFRQLLGAGVDVASAYLVRHKDEMIPAAMYRAAKAVEQKLAGKLRTEGVRPPENGMRPQGASFARKDVTKMSKADRNAICARVAKGEKIHL